jgi:hypothetical protein
MAQTRLGLNLSQTVTLWQVPSVGFRVPDDACDSHLFAGTEWSEALIPFSAAVFTCTTVPPKGTLRVTHTELDLQLRVRHGE